MGEITVTDIMLGELRAMRVEVGARLDKLVSTEAFAAEQRRVDDRHAVLADDIATERTERRQSETRTTASMRWLWTAVIVPIAGLVVTIYLATKG